MRANCEIVCKLFREAQQKQIKMQKPFTADICQTSISIAGENIALPINRGAEAQIS